MSVSSDERYTPEWLLDIVRTFNGGDIELDVCTAPSNPTRAIGFLTIVSNGLEQAWTPYGLNWCNPPYSRGEVIQWVTKASEEASQGCEILMLTQADVSTQWFRAARSSADCVSLLRKRVGFVTPDGKAMPGAKFGSAMWYWGRRRARFGRFFGGDVGWVLQLPGGE